MIDRLNNLKRYVMLATVCLLLASVVDAQPVSMAVSAKPTRVAVLPAGKSGYQPAVGRFGLFAPPPLSKPHPALSHPEQSAIQQDKKQYATKVPTPVFHPPCTDSNACLTAFDTGDFSANAFFDRQSYCASVEQQIYNGKKEIVTQRPLVEWGLPFYSSGPIPISGTQFGITNLTQQKFYIYGDWRTALAQNDLVNQENTVLATRLNLELDYWITATERVHAFVGPFQDGGNFTRIEDGNFEGEFDLFNADTDTFFFEGDFGQIMGGMEGRYAEYDLPFTVGLVPLLFQNGVWALDAMIGAAATLPAKNSPMLDWSNYDITFFAAVDRISTGAFGFDEDAGALFGMHTFIESRGGYFEAGYAFVDDQEGAGRSYHNLGLSYTRRYMNRVSNSVRAIINAGQNPDGSPQTADGVLLLVENTLITKDPYNFLPYVNFFAGFDRPQPLARAGAFGGVLFNSGILFQSDALTGYPTLDATGNNTIGTAMGLELINPSYDQQLFLEFAALHVHNTNSLNAAAGNQYGLGMRWQKKLTTSTLVRADAMVGILENSDDISGARVEYRWKF